MCGLQVKEIKNIRKQRNINTKSKLAKPSIYGICEPIKDSCRVTSGEDHTRNVRDIEYECLDLNKKQRYESVPTFSEKLSFYHISH